MLFRTVNRSSIDNTVLSFSTLFQSSGTTLSILMIGRKSPASSRIFTVLEYDSLASFNPLFVGKHLMFWMYQKIYDGINVVLLSCLPQAISSRVKTSFPAPKLYAV